MIQIRFRPPGISASSAVLVLSFAATACATQGTPPRMSAIQNEEAAEAHERASSAADPCRADRLAVEVPCWTAHPDAQEQQRLAAEHRHAADLQRAEESACAGVPDQDRRESPFSHRPDIVSVRPVLHELPNGQVLNAGTVVVFRKVPHLNAELLRQIVDCQLARNAALGGEREDLEYCPLTMSPASLKDLKLGVVEQSDGFALTLEVADETLARELMRRAQLAAGQTVSSRDSKLASP